jgi:hypothetical protein
VARQEATADMAATRGAMEEKMREAREAQEVQARAAREALQGMHDALEKHKARPDPCNPPCDPPPHTHTAHTTRHPPPATRHPPPSTSLTPTGRPADPPVRQARVALQAVALAELRAKEAAAVRDEIVRVRARVRVRVRVH